PIKILEEKREGLINLFLQNKSSDFLYKHCGLIDEYFKSAFEVAGGNKSIKPDIERYAIVALGGYGRREQAICSDIDIMILFEEGIPKSSEDFISEVVYPLWDLKFELGYSFKNVNEPIKIEKEHFETFTALLDSRFVCGNKGLYLKLVKNLKEKLESSESQTITDWLIETNRKRHKKFGDSSYLLEPNLKEGKGGLRDYHTILWIARIKFGLKDFKDLERVGIFSHEEFNRLKDCLDFIWNVRNRLHYITKRKCDYFYKEYQMPAALDMGFTQEKNRKPVEVFLGILHNRMEFIKYLFLIFIYEKCRSRTERIKDKQVDKPDKRLVIKEGYIQYVSSEAILEDPKLLIKIFEYSAKLNIPLSAEANRVTEDFLYLIEGKYQNSPEILKSFENILLAPLSDFNPLNLMLNIGVLVKYIPEFKEITDLIQYNDYHLYPVDKHSIYTLKTIKRFGRSEDITSDALCDELYTTLENKKPLLWAALLHDIGKGYSVGEHSKIGAKIATEILKRKKLKTKDIDVVSFLIENHLFLIKTATRRDIQDEGTAIFCARKIKSIKRLAMLYLLTVADSIATGPKAWNKWTEALLQDIFFKTYNIIDKGELASEQTIEIIEEKKKEIIPLNSSVFKAMSPRYLLYTDIKDIKDHIKLYGRLKNNSFVWHIKKVIESDTRKITLCAQDKPGLFSKIAGVLTLNGIEILDANINTWTNGIALDIFKVKPPQDKIFEKEKWKKAAIDIGFALAGKLNIKEALKKRKRDYNIERDKNKGENKADNAHINNNISKFFSIIEVTTYNAPDILFRITDAIFEKDIDIRIAKIATKADRIIDVFYVRNLYGEKIVSPDKIEGLKTAIYDALA
ncbi:MAG: [protein-PII] uridylyltransferase, partial [Deltaproteobacteria bacterium]|nr:[protein-PII] uridylyltransferase [Deltaproteobacteria bacterium]